MYHMSLQYHYNDKHAFFGGSQNLKLRQKHLTCFLSGPLDTLRGGGGGGIFPMDNKKYTILYRPKPYDNIRELVHALTIRISSYGCTWEVLRRLKEQGARVASGALQISHVHP